MLIGVSFNDQSLETALGAKRVKKLIVFARMSSNDDTISICCDDRAAMTAITQHVFSSGYRNPLFIAGPQTQSAHLQRKELFLSQWETATGLRPQFTSVERYDPKLTYDLIVNLFRDRPKSEFPDVLVCENDALAMGAIDAIRFEFGLRVPEDIAVSDFDNTPQSSSPHYELTTYRQPLTEMAEALVDVLDGKKRTEKLHAFLGNLIIRKSA